MHKVEVVFNGSTSTVVSKPFNFQDFTNMSIQAKGLGSGDSIVVYGSLFDSNTPSDFLPILTITTNDIHILKPYYRWYKFSLIKATSSLVYASVYCVTDGVFDTSTTGDTNVDIYPGSPIGGITPSSDGFVSYNKDAYSILNTIPMVAGDEIDIYGLAVHGNVQAEVDLGIQGSDYKKELVGGITESYPIFNPYLGAPLNIKAIINQSIVLRIKALRDKTGQASGRLFARKV